MASSSSRGSCQISRELREEAWDAFRDYEEVVVTHVLKHPGWVLDDGALHVALASEDEQVVRQFIEKLRAECEGFLSRVCRSEEWE